MIPLSAGKVTTNSMAREAMIYFGEEPETTSFPGVSAQISSTLPQGTG